MGHLRARRATNANEIEDSLYNSEKPNRNVQPQTPRRGLQGRLLRQKQNVKNISVNYMRNSLSWFRRVTQRRQGNTRVGYRNLKRGNLQNIRTRHGRWGLQDK